MNSKKKYAAMTRCSNARKYKALQPPTCGCDMCALKWQQKSDIRALRDTITAKTNDYL